MTGILYAVAEIAVFMVAALVVGIIIGRLTKRRAPRPAATGDSVDLMAAQSTIRDLETERAQLREQLRDAKERTRLLAAENTNAERSEGFAEEKKKLETELSEAEARADRLRATIAERDKRIASLTSGETPDEAEEQIGTVGYSHSAGSFADTKIVFSEEDE